MRKIGLVTTSRSDWGIVRPIAQALQERQDVELRILAGGMHLSATFGDTVDQIHADGFSCVQHLIYLREGDTPEAIARSMSGGVSAFARVWAQWRPDVLLVTADRFDMFPAALAATPFLIPIAHLHGGEITLGSFDDSLRHALTKLAHIHLVATEECARRVRQMGESAERIHVVGAPGLDDIRTLEPLSDAQLRADFGFVRGEMNLLVVYHPVTRAYERTAQEVTELFQALESLDAHLVIVRPNADTAHGVINRAIDGFRRGHGLARVAVSLPRRTFLSLMGAASAIVGNSSAGILEAPSFRLPAVNVGVRQQGRLRAANVIDGEAHAEAIRVAIRKALDPGFLKSLEGLINPYGDGHSAERIAEILARSPLRPDWVFKPFVDM